jgi:hypothetical protein
MQAGHGYITESPTGPHLELRAGNVPMGAATGDFSAVTVHARGAAGDRLLLIDANGPISDVTIAGDDWRQDFSFRPHRFLRAEIIAAASRDGLIADFTAALGGRELPWQLQGADLASQPIRRALSNPIYVVRDEASW